MQIVVTDEHIKNGTLSTRSCPYALAIRDACPNLEPIGRVRVYNTSVHIDVHDEGTGFMYYLPAEVSDWIKQFDMTWNTSMDLAQDIKKLPAPPVLELPLEKYC